MIDPFLVPQHEIDADLRDTLMDILFEFSENFCRDCMLEMVDEVYDQLEEDDNDFVSEM